MDDSLVANANAHVDLVGVQAASPTVARQHDDGSAARRAPGDQAGAGAGAGAQQQARGRPPGLQSLSDEEVALLGRLKDRRSAAEDVYRALRRAEAAANAAAQVRPPSLPPETLIRALSPPGNLN